MLTLAGKCVLFPIPTTLRRPAIILPARTAPTRTTHLHVMLLSIAQQVGCPELVKSRITGGVDTLWFDLSCRYRAIKLRNQPLDFSATLSKMKALGFVTSHASGSGTQGRPREIKRSCVTVMEKLGQGAFGEVGQI